MEFDWNYLPIFLALRPLLASHRKARGSFCDAPCNRYRWAITRYMCRLDNMVNWCHRGHYKGKWRVRGPNILTFF